MNHETDPHGAHDVLDHIRPTVVVRRRIWEPPPRAARPAEREEEDEAEDEEEREIVAAPEPRPISVAPGLPRRTLEVPDATPLPDLARRMGVAVSELVAELVARGWFEVTARTKIPRRAAKQVAAAFGWNIADDDDVPPSRSSGVVLRPARRARPSRARGASKAALAKKRTSPSSSPPARSRKRAA